jgi:hypothetical protein
MKKEPKKVVKRKSCVNSCNGSCGGLYFVGFIGALIFNLQQSVGFWNGILAVLKAAVWPAFLVYKLFGM